MKLLNWRSTPFSARTAAKGCCRPVCVGGMQLPLVAKALQSGRLVRVLPDWRLPDRFLYAVFPDARFISWRVRRIIQLIETVLEDWPGVAFSS
ncbi:hypothetical protein [Pantoea septica]|uniref:hypothetical protein n=1 Tax=Pantoea septica TaxID=472695 RepID=UPI0039C964D5